MQPTPYERHRFLNFTAHDDVPRFVPDADTGRGRRSAVWTIAEDRAQHLLQTR